MTMHGPGHVKKWLGERLMKLLEAEKELTRHSDELAQRRRALPGSASTRSIDSTPTKRGAPRWQTFFGGVHLLVYHFMFGPDYTAGCPSCSMIADGFNGFAVHLAHHDVMLWAVSRAPLAKLQAYKRRMEWTFPWASSSKNEFNSDFSVSFTEDEQRAGGIEYTIGGGHAMDANSAPEPVRGCGHVRNRCAHLYARSAGHERVRGGRSGLSQLLDLCARPRWPGARTSARPGTLGP
jgi:predicted dithiol-disulfide oxidoreductase (DUF899 family)